MPAKHHFRDLAHIKRWLQTSWVGSRMLDEIIQDDAPAINLVLAVQHADRVELYGRRTTRVKVVTQLHTAPDHEALAEYYLDECLPRGWRVWHEPRHLLAVLQPRRLEPSDYDESQLSWDMTMAALGRELRCVLTGAKA